MYPTMRLLAVANRLLLLSSSLLTTLPSRCHAFSLARLSGHHHTLQKGAPMIRLLAHSSSTSSGPPITHVNKEEMEEILEDYEEGGREESLYVVIDVRGEDEVYYTGKLSPSVHILPLPVIMQRDVFNMDPDDFEEFCGFEKPTFDETLVFSCAAGVRSVYACQFAAKAGYTKLINYVGGSNEWFSR